MIQVKTVGDLIAALQTMPPDVRVGYVWDGEVRSTVDWVWLAHDGRSVVVANGSEDLYTPDDRPTGAQDDEYWHVPAGFDDD